MMAIKKYDKMVRDNIPEVLDGQKKKYVIEEIPYRMRSEYIKKKILEEVDEFFETPCVDEAADIFEAFKAMISESGIEYDHVLIAADIKREIKGGFNKKLLLKEISD